MKRSIYILLTCLNIALLTACSKAKQATPQQAAKLWMQALLNGNQAAANEYSTTPVHFLNAQTIKNLNNNKPAQDKIHREIDELDSCAIVIEGDIAKIYKPGDIKNPLRLKKVNGRWRVDYKETHAEK